MSWNYAYGKCKQGEERQLQHETLQCCFEAGRFLLQINAEDLPPSDYLTYLGRTIAHNNSYWTAIYQNMMKVQRRWGVLTRVLKNTVAMV